MPGPIKQVTDMVVDEISLVDRPANQYANIVIAKRDTPEDTVPEKQEQYFYGDGSVVDLADLEPGDIVLDADSKPVEFYIPEEEAAPELAMAKNSPFGQALTTSSSLDALTAELSKAITDGDHAEVITKALGEIAKYEARTQAAESIAKGERDLRLNREYIAKAAEYNLPIEPDELGPVLKSMWEAEAELKVLPAGACAVIHKALSTAGAILFEELGYEGQAAASVSDEVEAYVKEQVESRIGKGDGATITKSQATRDYYAANPRAYDNYLAER